MNWCWIQLNCHFCVWNVPFAIGFHLDVVIFRANLSLWNCNYCHFFFLLHIASKQRSKINLTTMLKIVMQICIQWVSLDEIRKKSYSWLVCPSSQISQQQTECDLAKYETIHTQQILNTTKQGKSVINTCDHKSTKNEQKKKKELT